MGCGNWFANEAMFVSWVSFGESQARELSVRMFRGLLRREMEWFDMVRYGIGSADRSSSDIELFAPQTLMM